MAERGFNRSPAFFRRGKRKAGRVCRIELEDSDGVIHSVVERTVQIADKDHCRQNGNREKNGKLGVMLCWVPRFGLGGLIGSHSHSISGYTGFHSAATRLANTMCATLHGRIELLGKKRQNIERNGSSCVLQSDCS
ncbi:MAG: hypothetical protein KKH12_02315 [Gammaproteobacteria bacterium]|nr:hypothetical protein [Gammaproteobacteria bacterium]